MRVAVAFSQGDAVGWICLLVGIAVLGSGLAIGLWTSLKRPAKPVEEARAKLDEAGSRIEEARERIEHAAAGTQSSLESVPASAAAAGAAAQEAHESVQEARTAFEQVGEIVSALPENLRFAGLLVLVGAVLIGVATVQFGGVSLF